MRDPVTAFDVENALAAGMRVSLLSLSWTLGAGAGAIAIGLTSDSLVLVAFGALSLLDAAGSAALVIHFKHALRHESISIRHEKVALGIITIGMAILGITTAGESVDRLVTQSGGRADLAGVVLAALSLVVLATLSVFKRRIAPRIPSHALHSDGWLSAMGSMLALVALAGTALAAAYGWWWLDPVASLGIATGAIGLSYALFRSGQGSVELPSMSNCAV